MPKTETVTVPTGLRAFRFHGVELSSNSAGQAVGDCPFCGKERKFYANQESGLWDCKSCGRAGNVLEFLRSLWKESFAKTGDADYETLAKERGYGVPDGLVLWGACKSIITDEWLVPGYSPECDIAQAYRYTNLKGTDGVWRRRLIPSPGLDGDTTRHGIHGLGTIQKWGEVNTVYVAEGFWDGVALRNTLQAARKDVAVIAVPGCNVFPEQWCRLFSGKEVVLLFHNDHPRRNKAGELQPPVGFKATERVVGLLRGCGKPPAKIRYLSWGKKGFDERLSDGYDIRDHLKAKKPLRELLSRVTSAPDSWVPVVSDLTRLPSKLCGRFGEVVSAWKNAIRWRQELEDVLSVMLAVALSTDQVGNQLFLQVISDAGSNKTCFCDAMLTSKHCYPLEHIKGFHSGRFDGSGEDFSLIAKVNHKTLITPEGDLLVSSPNFTEVMSQQRRIFDGSTSSSYRNGKGDTRYTGLRTPWIMAGTPAILDSDNSRLGDRFLRVRINQPDEAEKDAILLSVAQSAYESVGVLSNCSPASSLPPKLAKAYQLTGGFIDHLRQDAQPLLAKVLQNTDTDILFRKCMVLGKFVSYLRARDSVDPKKDTEATKELPTRLTHQLTRLAVCLSVVLGDDKVTDRVIRVTTKVAVDTARGPILDIVKELHKTGQSGATLGQLASWTGKGEEREKIRLRFMHQIGILDRFQERKAGGVRPLVHYRLTEEMKSLFEEVCGA